MPIVGQFGGIGAAGFFVPGGAFESIATVTVGSGGASSITFSDIPAGFQHLQVRAQTRNTQNVGGDNVVMHFNSDTTYTNYRSHYLDGNGTAAAAGTFQLTWATGTVIAENVADALYTSSIFSGIVVDILDYASTSKYKTIRSLAGSDNNGSGRIAVCSAVWMSTSAVTGLTVKCYPGNVSSTLAQYSTVALYGVRA